MAKTYENLLDEARVLLQDTAGDRYTDTVLLGILNRAIADLCRMRPDACYDLFANNQLNFPEVVATGAGTGQSDLADDFGFDLMFYTPIVSYVVGVAEVVDDEYTVDGRAAMLLSQYRSTILGV